LIDGNGHPPAVGEPRRDQATAAGDLVPLLLEQSLLVFGDHRRLVAGPLLVDPRTGQDRDPGGAGRPTEPQLAHRAGHRAGIGPDGSGSSRADSSEAGPSAIAGTSGGLERFATSRAGGTPASRVSTTRAG